MKIILGIVAAVVALSAGYFVINGGGEPMKAEKGAQVQDQFRRSEVPQTTEEYEVDQADFVDAPTLLNDLGTGDISEAEATGILFMYEEEKLARDVYRALYEQWGSQIFSNIAASEQTHMDAVETLVERYELELTVEDTPGTFTNLDLQTLYYVLVDQGSASVADAYRVGAKIEDLDINDLDYFIRETDESDIILVYENLQRGSRNHLRAFNRQLQKTTGESYVPELISQVAFDDIINSDTERGPRGGRR